jgi:hypothetical protein
MKSPTPKLFVVATTALTLFAAGCLIILWVFVPMWQQAAPAEFLNWLSRNGKKVGAVMLPLEMAPLFLSLFAYVKAKRQNQPFSSWLAAINILNLCMISLFFLYFLPVNARLMDGTIALNKVGDTLLSWKTLHLVRTGLAMVAAGLGWLFLYQVTRKKKSLLNGCTMENWQPVVGTKI